MNCSNRNEILSLISRLKQEKSDVPPKFVTNPSLPDKYIESALAGKAFLQLPTEEINLLYGDFFIFNLDAFLYYLPDFVENIFISEEPPPLVDMFLLSLTPNTLNKTNKLEFLNCDYIKLLYLFFECIHDIIEKSTVIDFVMLKEDYGDEISLSFKEYRNIYEQRCKQDIV